MSNGWLVQLVLLGSLVLPAFLVLLFVLLDFLALAQHAGGHHAFEILGRRLGRRTWSRKLRVETVHAHRLMLLKFLLAISTAFSIAHRSTMLTLDLGALAGRRWC